MRSFPPAPQAFLHRWSKLAVGASVAVAGIAALPATASASHSQLAIIQDGSDLSDPNGALTEFRQLGANTVRVVIPWQQVAPSPNATRKPKFNAADPNAYPKNAWAPFDNVVFAAQRLGMKVDLTVTGGAPHWAEAKPPKVTGANAAFFAWKPHVNDYAQFVRAAGTRYSGHFKPAGSSAAVPAVHVWAIFNEPNFGEDLGPQATNDSTVASGPAMYRNIANAGYNALKATGHGRDTIMIGELAAQGAEPGRSPRKSGGLPGNFGQTRPLLFLRDLYCVNSSFRELRGSAAKAIGCPTTGGASRSFRRKNPGLFNVTGVSVHPYAENQSPVSHARNKVDYAIFQDRATLMSTVDRLNRTYGSHKKFPIYNTEYGYITNPPHPPTTVHYVSPATAAFYINWAEYLSWKDPRMGSYMQYLLKDPPPNAGVYAGFATGLDFFSGAHKPSYDAFRLPVFMPHTSFSHSANEEIWGNVRPAPFMTKDGQGPQAVAIQLNGKTIKTVTANGYFDTKLKFPTSGTVRLAYTYPKTDPFLPAANAGQTVFSRSFKVSVR